MNTNGLELIRPAIMPIDWTSNAGDFAEISTTDPQLEEFDTILLTDCIFAMELVDGLVNTIRKYSSSSKTTVICCHEIRDEVFEI
jgi:hypothetical protein